MDQKNELTHLDQPQKQDIKIANCEAPGGASQVYANHVQVSWTGFDVQMRLSHLHRLPDEPPTNRVEHRATVTMAWPEAKALLDVLADVIGRYEAINGEIKIPTVP